MATEERQWTDAERWYRERYSVTPERSAPFTTLSGEPIRPLYGPEDVGSFEERIGYPGVYPFTRGVYPSMYRGRLWTMRQFAGFGTAEETNERFRYLLEHGQTGLSTAFDMPSLMGHDSDHPRSLGEVGREGVAVDTLDDMQTLFGGIDLGEVTVSMTINAPAAIMMAFYVVAAEEAGVPRDRLGGTIQADILKEYIAQKEWCFPVDPAMRLLGDMMEWSTREMPRWHPVSISGYHIREAGLDGRAGVRAARKQLRHERLGRLADLRDLDLQLPLERLHRAGAKAVAKRRVVVAQPALMRRPTLIASPSQPGVELVLHGPLDDQPGTQPGQLRQRLARVLADPHGKQLVDLRFDLRRRRYGTSHGVGPPSSSCRT